jgi:hypothetical protein
MTAQSVAGDRTAFPHRGRPGRPVPDQRLQQGGGPRAHWRTLPECALPLCPRSHLVHGATGRLPARWSCSPWISPGCLRRQARTRLPPSAPARTDRGILRCDFRNRQFGHRHFRGRFLGHRARRAVRARRPPGRLVGPRRRSTAPDGRTALQRALSARASAFPTICIRPLISGRSPAEHRDLLICVPSHSFRGILGSHSPHPAERRANRLGHQGFRARFRTPAA